MTFPRGLRRGAVSTGGFAALRVADIRAGGLALSGGPFFGGRPGRGGPFRACEALGDGRGRRAFCLSVLDPASLFLLGAKTASFPGARTNGS